MRKPITYFAFSLFIFGITGFVFNLVVGSGLISFNGELPIYGGQGVVERNSRLYIGLGFYSRVQIYDLDGNYVDYKKTSNYSKDFDFTIDNTGNPKIIVNYYKDEVNKILNGALNSTCIDDSCIRYTIERKLPLRMVCYGKEGREIVIEQAIFKSLWSGPIKPWIIGIGGLFLFCLMNISVMKRELGLAGGAKEKLIRLIKETFK